MMYFFDNKDRLGAFILLVCSLIYLRSSMDIPLDPFDLEVGFTSRSLPIFLSVSAIFISLLLVFFSVFDSDAKSVSDELSHIGWRPMLALILLMAVYVTTFNYLGFVLASALFLQIAFMLLGERRLLLSVCVSLGLILFLWFILTQVFGLYLDSGTLYRELRS
ncbi:MAG: tripartite tricarboxylate transporter TctB family protein [Porticoccaceae bacterium]